MRLAEYTTRDPSASVLYAVVHPFKSERAFAVTLPARGAAPDRLVTGSLTELGGGFEAWIFHGDAPARVYRSDSGDTAVEYLKQYRERLAQEGGKDHD